jgi:hypothetical protein
MRTFAATRVFANVVQELPAAHGWMEPSRLADDDRPSRK